MRSGSCYKVSLKTLEMCHGGERRGENKLQLDIPGRLPEKSDIRTGF